MAGVFNALGMIKGLGAVGMGRLKESEFGTSHLLQTQVTLGLPRAMRVSTDMDRQMRWYQMSQLSHWIQSVRQSEWQEPQGKAATS